MDFQEYLHSKKIDSEAFRKANPGQWEEWKYVFDQVHPASFTSQKLFLINPLRRLFPYHQEQVASKPTVDKPKKPLIRAKPKERGTGEETVKPKPKIRPKPMVKPKIVPRADEENKAKEKIKPNIKPKPVIKKRPNTD